MDVGSVSSTYRVAPVDAVRASGPTVAGSAAADLPPTAVVAQPDDVVFAGDRPKAELPQTSGNLEPRVVIDPDTQAVVFQSVDDLTQDVVNQFPDQAMLRRKAYLDKLDEAKSESGFLSGQLARIV